ncbi:MAG TPA: hypothetical protein DDX39_11265 [Bacteroidales bacterium]|nr:MAG: hypothetical protein A2W98_13860 [Bacteroidetes bacterium GWF2_33_38]OFY74316.1 MAG: hypothetical protein A2265_05530 [Bacteroidetes bacterium RIFOXYA12_FULL_33_9]OFY90993.1 MAG: hypothetical protein A2236_03495 [Bacteroidetes bacterium RIFOXYA2_FULL_33_7]HBF89210.1 hypothetical protein [Bacteroidales bacterium]
MFPIVEKKILKKMDFLSDQKGIIRRFEREEKNWIPHLENTKNKITKSIGGKNNKCVIVLGSGWCLDVPLHDLSQNFETVHLVDIFHPSHIQKEVQKFSNVKLIEADITNGLIEKAFYFVQKNKKATTFDFNELLSIPKIDISDYDFIVSVNILNQLDILIVDYLQKYLKISSENIENTRRFIQNYHIEMMPAKKSLLISDFEEILFDKKDIERSRKKLIYSNLFNPEVGEKWIWKFDTKKMYNTNYKTYFNVIAIDL